MAKQWTSYELSFAEEALSRLPGVVPKTYFGCIASNFEKLKENPTALGERCALPYPGTKHYQFDCLEGDHGFVFRAHFIFNHQETHILVFDVTVVANW